MNYDDLPEKVVKRISLEKPPKLPEQSEQKLKNAKNQIDNIIRKQSCSNIDPADLPHQEEAKIPPSFSNNNAQEPEQ